MLNRAHLTSIPALALILSVTACGGSSQPEPTTPAKVAVPAGAADLSPEEAGGVPKDPNEKATAPHGGAMVELGSKAAYLEFVYDQTAGKLTMYLMDGDAMTPVGLPAKIVQVSVTPEGSTSSQFIVLAAVDGSAPGGATEFAATSRTMQGVARFGGVVTDFSLKGQSFGDVAFSIPM